MSNCMIKWNFSLIKIPAKKTGDKFADDNAGAPDHRLFRERQQAWQSWNMGVFP